MDQHSKMDETLMPVWKDDSTLDCGWVAKKTGITTLRSCHVTDISNQSRRAAVVRDGCTLLLTLQHENKEVEDDNKMQSESVQYLVIKQVSGSNDRQSDLSRTLGLSREAFFYHDLTPLLKDKGRLCLPKIFYSYGNQESGEKCVIMEYLNPVSWIDSGVLFGPGNPNNWNRNLNVILSKVYMAKQPPSAASVAMITFKSIARIHAYFWKNESLLLANDRYSWLRGHGWIQKKHRETWESSQNIISNAWKNYCTEEVKSIQQMEQSSTISKAFIWDPIVRSAVEKAVSSISWQSQIERLNVDGNWTLVHGDFWPGNVMINSNFSDNDVDDTGNASIRLVDWEMVGIGSGPQDLGQYVLSNFCGSERRSCEKELVQAYYNELIASGVSNVFSFDECWREYAVGGVERWIWFLIWFLGQGESLQGWAQFFHNQIAEFMYDHGLSAEHITQPRP